MKMRYNNKKHPIWNSKGRDWVGTQPLIDEIKNHAVTTFLPLGTLKTYIPTIRRFLNDQRRTPDKITNKNLQEYFRRIYLTKKLKYNTLYTYKEALKWYFKNILDKDQKCSKIHIGRIERDLLPLVEVKEFYELV